MRGSSSPNGNDRWSALWGSGRSGGNSDVRNGRMRGLAVVLAVTTALAATLAAGAGAAKSAQTRSSGDIGALYVDPQLLDLAQNSPNTKVRIIIQSTGGAREARTAFNDASHADGNQDNHDGDHFGRMLGLIRAGSGEIKAKKIKKLARIPGLIITLDSVVKQSGFSTGQIWPKETGNQQLWSSIDANLLRPMPTIAIVDSGIDANRADFAGRVLAEVNLATATPNSPGDGRGHGTFVAGIAAGAAGGYAGAAPGANLVSLDVMNDAGMAWTSDVIAATQWILANKATYNIRVANFSMHTDNPSTFQFDPLDRAVEQLWFNGVTVVAAAGNYGLGATPSGVYYAPGNDPFVVTVGAVDLNGTGKLNDDFVAPWSAYGYTLDGFAKPDIATAGRYMVGPVPAGATLPLERPANVTAPGYMQLSGTSFAAPVVAGTVAHILALHPAFTPDQVKGALMLTARMVPFQPPLSVGVGELNAIRAATVESPPNPNLALDQFVATDPLTGSMAFDTASWNSAVLASASWNSASWSSASWSSASWSSASWSSASWSSASWSSASWNSASWSSAALADSAREDAVSSDINGNPDGVPLTPTEDLALSTDPDLTPTPGTILP